MKIRLDSGIVDAILGILTFALIMAMLVDINDKADKAMLEYISSDSKEFLNIEGSENAKTNTNKANIIP